MNIPADIPVQSPVTFTLPAAQGHPDAGEYALLVLTRLEGCTCALNGGEPTPAGDALVVIRPGDSFTLTPTGGTPGWARGFYDTLPGRVTHGFRYASVDWQNTSSMSSSTNRLTTAFTSTARKPAGSVTPQESALILSSFSSLAGVEATLSREGNVLGAYTFSSEVLIPAPGTAGVYRALLLPASGFNLYPDDALELSVFRADGTGNIKAFVGSPDQAFDGGANGAAQMGVTGLSSTRTTTTNSTPAATTYHLQFEIGHFTAPA